MHFYCECTQGDYIVEGKDEWEVRTKISQMIKVSWCGISTLPMTIKKISGPLFIMKTLTSHDGVY